MPEGLLTLLDIKKLDAGIGFDLIEENVRKAPELRLIPAEPIAGTEIKLTVRTGLPDVRFRKLNQGTPRSKSKYEDRVFSTAVLDHQVAVDRQVVRSSLNPTRPLENHASGAVEAAFRHGGKQFYYGVNNDELGFPGVIAQMLDDEDHVIDAGASSDKTSVFFFHIGRETVQFLFGNGTTINFDEEWKEETVYDDNNNPYQALTNWMTGALGARVANKHSVLRIKGIGKTANKLTDELLYEGLDKFETMSGLAPTHLYMTSRSREQLRSSRTITSTPSGGSKSTVLFNGLPPPLPTTWEDIPIIVTQSISNNELI